MFAKMTLDQWTDTLQSKVQGSLNLERHLSASNLSFSVFLSSVCGIIGASGQSNYAFGCAYQDALARREASTKQKRAISIDLGIVEGVGYTAEHQGTGAFMRSLGLQPIPEEYLLALLEYYCDSARRHEHEFEEEGAQVVAGVMTQEEMQRRGIIRSRFYARPLWKHLQQRDVVTTTVTKRGSKKKPAAAVAAKMSSAEPVVDDIPVVEESHSSLLSGSPSQHQQRHQQHQDSDGAALISRAICERLSDLLAIGAEDIDPAKPLHMYGVDSLVAMELRGWFKEALQKDVAVFDIMSNRPIEVLALEVEARS